MDRWQALCRDAKISLLEDCAQAHLASSQGHVAGGFGACGAYSFYPTKNLGTLGDGGALVTSRSDLAEAFAQLRNYGQSVRYHHPVLGMNSRLDELHAAILSARLNWLEEFNARRRQIADVYRSGLRSNRFELLAPPLEAANHVHHLFVIRCKHRSDLMEHLKLRGIETQIHYPIPVHKQKPCADIRIDPRGLPFAEAHADECISIPCHPQLRDADVIEVVDALNCF